MANTHETKNKLRITFISRVPCPGYLVYEVELENKDKKKSVKYDLTKLRSRNGRNISIDGNTIGDYELLTTGIIEPKQIITGYVALQPNVLYTNRPSFYLDGEKWQIRVKKAVE